MKKIFIILFGLIVLAVIILFIIKNTNILENNNLFSQVSGVKEDKDDKVAKAIKKIKNRKVTKEQKEDINDPRYEDIRRLRYANELFEIGEKCELYGFEMTINNYTITSDNLDESFIYTDIYEKPNEKKVYLIVDMTIKYKNKLFDNMVFGTGNLVLCETDSDNKLSEVLEVCATNKPDSSVKDMEMEYMDVGETINRKVVFLLYEKDLENPNKFLLFDFGGGDSRGDSPVQLYDLSKCKK